MTDSHGEEYRRVALRLTGELNQLLKDLRAQIDYTEKQIGEVVTELEILRLSHLRMLLLLGQRSMKQES